MQVSGEAIVGRLTGTRLTPLPDTAVRSTKRAALPFLCPKTAVIPGSTPGEVALGVDMGDTLRAYPIERVGDGVINDEIEGTALVIFSQEQGPTGAAYLSSVDGRALTFTWADILITDNETGSTWAFTRTAVAGELAGTQLQPLPVRSAFWFSLIAAFPDLTLYQE